MRIDRSRRRRRKRSVMRAVIWAEAIAIVLVSGALYLAVEQGMNGSGNALAKVWVRIFGGSSPEDRDNRPEDVLDSTSSGSEVKAAADLLEEYMGFLAERDYGKMYDMLDADASGGISQEEFVRRNSAIYEGIEMADLTVEIMEGDRESGVVNYRTSFDTIAGEIYFANEAFFIEKEGVYRLVWSDSLIFPGMGSGDRVRVRTVKAERGRILDRNDRLLAGAGLVSSVGLVPGKLEDREEAIQRAAELLEMDTETVEKKLSAGWVKEDSFVPLKRIPRVEEMQLMSPEAQEEMGRELERHEALLEIPGVKIADEEVRSYPYGVSAAHLVGYVQTVTAQDL